MASADSSDGGGTVSALTDVFRNAAKEYHASFPTTGERRRFIETARKSLAYADAFKTMPARTRKAWMTGAVETDTQEATVVLLLVVAIKGIIKQAQDYRTGAKPVPARLGRQQRFASLILKGLNPDIGKAELVGVERDLLKLYNAATAAEASEQNKINREKVGDGAEDVRLQKLIRGMVGALKNKASSKNDRARYVLQKLNLHDRIWKTPNALIKWAHRRKIAI